MSTAVGGDCDSSDPIGPNNPPDVYEPDPCELNYDPCYCDGIGCYSPNLNTPGLLAYFKANLRIPGT